MKRILCLTVLFLCLMCMSASAQTIRVSPGEMSITQALSVCADGDEIVLLPGSYGESTETFPITITRSVTLRAEPGAVIDAPPFCAAFRIEAPDVAMSGLDIRFRHIGLYAIGDGLTLEKCHISLADPAWRTSSCAVWLGGIRGAHISGCEFTGCGVCMAGPPISSKSEGLPVLTGMFEVGEEKEYFTTHAIENCLVNGKPMYYLTGLETVQVPAGAGQVICADCGKVMLENQDVSDTSIGIQVMYADKVTVRSCRADRCGIFGIYLAKCGRGLIADSVAQQTNHGFDVRDCTDACLLRCNAVKCDQGLFFSFADRCMMVDCTVTETGQGIFTARGHNNLFYRCHVTDCENGLNIQKDADAVIRGCEVKGCTVCGIRLDASPSECSGCLIQDNWVGIMAYDPVSFTISDNRFISNRSCGLYLRDIGPSRIMGNTFAGHEKTGAEIRGALSGIFWYGNTLDRPVLVNGIETDEPF